MTRKEAEAKILELGGSTASRVTAATDLLIAGEKAGSKKKQAETLGIEIIDEAAFVLSKEQLKEIKTLLCSEDEADRQQAGEPLQAAQVTELDLSECDDLTDAGLSHLPGLTNLTTLNLNNCWSLTDAGLSHLLELSSLTMLDLDDCSKLTESAVDELREANASALPVLPASSNASIAPPYRFSLAWS